jgi:hypothetical protein
MRDCGQIFILCILVNFFLKFHYIHAIFCSHSCSPETIYDILAPHWTVVIDHAKLPYIISVTLILCYTQFIRYTKPVQELAAIKCIAHWESSILAANILVSRNLTPKFTISR